MKNTLEMISTSTSYSMVYKNKEYMIISGHDSITEMYEFEVYDDKDMKLTNEDLISEIEDAFSGLSRKQGA